MGGVIWTRLACSENVLDPAYISFAPPNKNQIGKYDGEIYFQGVLKIVLPME
jgi:hypothetical protein